ncbi:hypothetical protein EDD22DRAFT_254457 [Suillus occidentalis]|nr:hypothetical protein EDD22DRAFT_254457 [Suillus occidentalis]
MIGCTMMSFLIHVLVLVLVFGKPNSLLIPADITSWIGVSCQYQYQYININTFTRATWYNGSNYRRYIRLKTCVSNGGPHPRSALT